MALIEFVGNGFSIHVPAGWSRLATADHVAVFLGEMTGGVRSSMALTRFSGTVGDAASTALADHQERFKQYQLLHESASRLAHYRRYGWVHPNGSPVLQHQLFVEGMLLTCSRIDEFGSEGDDRVFLTALKSLRVAVRT